MRTKTCRTLNPSPKAFTLVELLVVIGIIALLISILLPALGAARKQANATRCASQLREIGNALQLYVSEYKSYLPMVRHQTSANTTWPPAETRGNPSFKFGSKGMNEYWYGYLLKYFTKNELKRNTAGDVSLKNYEKTPLYGCPEAQRTEIDILSATAADYNSGYGMGPYILYRPDRYRGVNGGSAGGLPTAAHWPMIEDGSTGGKKGRYMKITEVDKPAESGIISDSRSWFLEIRDPQGANPPPQYVGYLIYEPNQIDQFDRYRHGKYPPIVGSTYSLQGGKQLFNVLYVDGHVQAMGDVRDGYRAFRQKYPG